MAHCHWLPPAWRCARPWRAAGRIRRSDRMNGGPYATSRHLHEISKVRLRILARPYEINETSLARLELDL